MDPELYKAATQGNVHLLEQLIQKDPKVLSSVTPQENTALHIAARLGHKDLAEAILKKRDPLLIVKQNTDKDTPIHIAARAGHRDIVVSFIAYSNKLPIDIESDQKEPFRIVNKIGNTALHEAVQNRHTEIAIKLLHGEPSASHAVNVKKETPFHIAAREGLKEVVLEILKFSWVEEPEEGGPPRSGTGSPLHQAVLGGQCEIVEILLKERTDFIKLGDEIGNNALHYAAQLSNAKMVEMLLEKDTSLAYLINNDDKSSLHEAAACNSLSAIKEILRWCPDAAEQVDNKGQNALHIAVLCRSVGALKCLLKCIHSKEIINQADEEGNTPLHLAAMNCRIHSTLLLLKDKRVDPCILNNSNQMARGTIETMEAMDTYEMHILQSLKKSEERRCKKHHANPGFLTTRRSFKNKNIHADEHFKSCVSTYTLVAALIATVTFAATFTMPGGYNQATGYALLAGRPAFKVFVIFNTIAMCSSLVVVFCFIWAWKDPVRFKVRQLTWGHRLTVVASLAMIVALMTAVYVVVENECRWVAIVVVFICCSAPLILGAILGHDIWFIPY